MSEFGYEPPVSALLTYGSCLEVDKRFKDPARDRIVKQVLASGSANIDRSLLAEIKPRRKPETWPDYLEELGITATHVPDLIRMATDDELNWADGDSREVWAPVHAWRCLGFLRAEEAVAPLMGLLEEEESDWILEEIPWVFGLIGEGAIASSALYLANRGNSEWGRIAVVSALEYVAVLHPEQQERCIEKLASQLADYERSPESLNGFLVSALVELEATQKASLIGRAYSSGRVDSSICGNWPNVQIDMGLAKQEDFDPEDLEPDFEWVQDLAPNRKPTAFELGLPVKRPKPLTVATKTSQGFGSKGGGMKKKKTKKKKR